MFCLFLAAQKLSVFIVLVAWVTSWLASSIMSAGSILIFISFLLLSWILLTGARVSMIHSSYSTSEIWNISCNSCESSIIGRIFTVFNRLLSLVLQNWIFVFISFIFKVKTTPWCSLVWLITFSTSCILLGEFDNTISMSVGFWPCLYLVGFELRRVIFASSWNFSKMGIIFFRSGQL